MMFTLSRIQLTVKVLFLKVVFRYRFDDELNLLVQVGLLGDGAKSRPPFSSGATGCERVWTGALWRWTIVGNAGQA